MQGFSEKDLVSEKERKSVAQDNEGAGGIRLPHCDKFPLGRCVSSLLTPFLLR